jgi:hypothetical protein
MAKSGIFTNPYLVVPGKYGLVGGFLIILLFFLLLWFGSNPLVSNIYFSFFVIPLFVFFSVKEFKKYYNAGYLHFWQGMSLGFVCYMTMALLSSLFVWLYLEVLNPGLLQEYVVNRIEMMNATRENLVEQLGEETFIDALAKLKNVSPLDMALDGFFRNIFAGMFITIIIAVAMRRRPLNINQ